MRLMCDMELDFSKIGEALNLDFKSKFTKELQQLIPLDKDGLINLTDEGLEVTSIGRLLIRNIASVFDAYLGNHDAKFSKAV